MTAVASVYRWEIVKLLAQKRTYLGLGAALPRPHKIRGQVVLHNRGPHHRPRGR